jgi:hypothetical protein
MIKLRHDFKILPKSSGSGYLEYPFKRMLVMESFYFEKEDFPLKKIKTAIASFEAKTPGRHFEMQKVDDGYKVWRIA